jgi:hypothetical protein
MPSAPPSKLYKYYPPERVDIFTNWSLRFSRPADFNDTFDTDYTIHDKRDVRQRLKHKSKVAVFCLTEDPDNHLMWVNYARQHTGFVLGFDTTDSFFADKAGVLGKVKYQLAPPSMSFEVNPPLELCFIKSEDWAYEKEWRCVRTIPLGEKTDISLPHLAITEIIMGWKIPSSVRIELLDVVDGIAPDHQMAVSDSKPNRHTWEFSHEPTKYHLCKHCNGQGTIKDKA